MMKLLSTCFLTAALYGTEAQADTSLPAATPFAGVDKKLPMLELLPVGQVLPKVSLSRYEGPRLSMLLTASSVTVAAPQEIAANILNVYLYGKNNQTSHLFTQAASYFLDKKLAVSHTETTLREENLSAKGTGLYLDTNIKRGIILGPVQTTIRMAQRNKEPFLFMKKLSSLLLALAGSLACSGANGVPSHIVQPLPRELDPRLEQPLTPPSHIVRPLTEEETARRERELAPVPTAGLKEDGEKAIQTYSAQEKTVDGRIQEFRQQHQVAGNTPAPAAETTPSSAASGPEEGFLQANSPKDLYTVDCDGDLYFDMEEGVLVFMKNVRVRNPGLSMDCADHLKIYAEFVPKKPGDKKPSDIKKEKGKEENQTQVALPNGGNFDYNSIKTVAASGNVKASYTNKQTETSNAQAEKITYNAKTGEIILTGAPVIVTPDVIVKNPNKDAFIRVYSNGNMYGSRGTKTTFRHVDKKLSDRENQKTSRKP